jgi:NAD(P)-dependent dehydrogenase (short-subunit alcohol dehydrogenase family)
MSEHLNIVLTGASSGIGAALTRALAADGHRLFVCARRRDRLDAVTESGRIATPFVCDVSREAEVEHFVAAVGKSVASVQALINCAGLYGAIGSVAEVDSAAWMRAVKINLFGTFLMCKHVAPLMQPVDRPRIVNFAGGGAFSPLPRYSAYAVSKAAIVRLTETLAVELAERNVAVNAVAPGFVATEIHAATLEAGPEAAGPEFFAMTRDKMNAGAVPMDVPVGLVRYLLSPSAAALTGKTVSASFDPWQTPVFEANLEAINGSQLYTMQRVNLVNLPPDDSLRQTLTAARKK